MAAAAPEEVTVPQEVAGVALEEETVPPEAVDETVILSFHQYIGSHWRSVDEELALLDEYFNYLANFQAASSVVAEPVATLECFEQNENCVVPSQFPQRAEVVAEASESVPQELARGARAVEAIPQEVADEAAILSFDEYTGRHWRSVDEEMALLDEYFNYVSSFQSASSVAAEPVATLESYEHVSEDNGGGTAVEPGAAVAGSGSLFKYSEASRVADAPRPPIEQNSAVNMPPDIHQRWNFEVPDTRESSEHVSVDKEGALGAWGATAVAESLLLVASAEVSPVDSLNTLTEHE